MSRKLMNLVRMQIAYLSAASCHGNPFGMEQYRLKVATVKWDDSLCGFKCSDVTGNINFCFTAIAHCSEWSIVGNKFDKKSSVWKDK